MSIVDTCKGKLCFCYLAPSVTFCWLLKNHNFWQWYVSLGSGVQRCLIFPNCVYHKMKSLFWAAIPLWAIPPSFISIPFTRCPIGSRHGKLSSTSLSPVFSPSSGAAITLQDIACSQHTAPFLSKQGPADNPDNGIDRAIMGNHSRHWDNRRLDRGRPQTWRPIIATQGGESMWSHVFSPSDSRSPRRRVD